MKRLVAGLVLLTGSTPALAHTLSFHDGIAAFYHQILGIHHLPLTVLLIVIGIALFARRKTKDN